MLCQYYEADKLLPVRLAPRHTDDHIYVSSMSKMRVKCVCGLLGLGFPNCEQLSYAFRKAVVLSSLGGCSGVKHCI